MDSLKTTMLWRIEGDTLLCVHSTETPTEREWESVMVAIESLVERGRPRILVHTEGAAPHARQRSELNRVLGAVKPQVSVITASPVARAAGTAIAWFNPNFRVFAPDDVERAIGHLGVPHSEHDHVRRGLAELRFELRRHSTRPPRPLSAP